MNDQVVNEIIARLDILGAKLNVAGSAIWETLVRQASVQPICNFVALAILCIIALICAINFCKKADWKNGNGWTFSTVVSVLTFVPSFIVMCVIYSDFVTSINNPEYLALRELMSILR
jgi:hypothetical protein